MFLCLCPSITLYIYTLRFLKYTIPPPYQTYICSISAFCSLGLGMELVWSGYGGGMALVIIHPYMHNYTHQKSLTDSRLHICRMTLIYLVGEVGSQAGAKVLAFHVPLSPIAW